MKIGIDKMEKSVTPKRDKLEVSGLDKYDVRSYKKEIKLFLIKYYWKFSVPVIFFL